MVALYVNCAYFIGISRANRIYFGLKQMPVPDKMLVIWCFKEQKIK